MLFIDVDFILVYFFVQLSCTNINNGFWKIRNDYEVPFVLLCGKHSEKCMCLSSFSPLSSWCEKQDRKCTHTDTDTRSFCVLTFPPHILNRVLGALVSSIKDFVFSFNAAKFLCCYLWNIFYSNNLSKKFNIWDSFDQKIVRFVPQMFPCEWITFMAEIFVQGQRASERASDKKNC